MGELHSGGKLLEEKIGEPEKAVILLHGRGASADSILRLGKEVTDDALLLAPEAENREWYTESFLRPREENQPWLDSALERVEEMVEKAGEKGFGREAVHFAGFSQGACLAAEYTARNPARYGSVFVLSGGLIGETVDGDMFDGDMEDTYVFIGCSDEDQYIPLERVEETAAVFEQLNADVDKRIYEGMGHTINDEEKGVLREHLGDSERSES